MLCDICGKNPAVIHIQEITGTQRKVLNLCQECAEKKAREDSTFQSFNLAELLYHISSQFDQNGEPEQPSLPVPPAVPAGQQGKYEKLFCPACGWDYASFIKTGRLGCADCYKAFAEVLSDAIAQMHRGVIHVGKVPPKNTAGRQKPKTTKSMIRLDINRFQQELELCVREERYEEAARLRDRIAELRGRLEDMPDGK